MIWTYDWSKFNIDLEYDRVCEGYPTSFTNESFEEYIIWLKTNRPYHYMAFIYAELKDFFEKDI